MLEYMEVTDFDICLSDVILVHRNRFVEGFGFYDYRSGRRTDGLVLCVSGCGFFDFGGEGLVLRAGQALFLPKDSAYSVSCREQAPFIHYTVNFQLNGYEPEEGAVAEILRGSRRFVYEDGGDGRMGAVMERLLSVWQAKRNGYRVIAKAAVYELLAQYLTGVGRAFRDREGYRKLRTAKRIMDEEYCCDLPVGELATQCGLSETHFRRLWRRVFGMTPTAYLRGRRVARAKDLLLSGLYSVSEAAHEVGFDDANYFSRVFRKETGLSPSEFLPLGE